MFIKEAFVASAVLRELWRYLAPWGIWRGRQGEEGRGAEIILMGVLRVERYDKKIKIFKAPASHAEKVSVQFDHPLVVYAILLMPSSLSLQ